MLPHLSKTREDYARKLMFVTSVHTHLQYEKIYLLVPGPPYFADVSIFFCKKSAFFGQNSTFTQSNGMRAVSKSF